MSRTSDIRAVICFLVAVFLTAVSAISASHGMASADTATPVSAMTQVTSGAEMTDQRTLFIGQSCNIHFGCPALFCEDKQEAFLDRVGSGRILIASRFATGTKPGADHPPPIRIR